MSFNPPIRIQRRDLDGLRSAPSSTSKATMTHEVRTSATRAMTEAESAGFLRSARNGSLVGASRFASTRVKLAPVCSPSYRGPLRVSAIFSLISLQAMLEA